MPAKKKKVSRTELPQTRTARKKKPRGKSFPKGEQSGVPFKSKEELGGELDPRINAGGRPKALGAAYKDILAAPVYPDDLEETERKRIVHYTGSSEVEISYAVVVGMRLVHMASLGDVQAARELRTATEGEKMRLETWQTEFVEALKRGQVTPQELVDELGIEDARPILVAAGTPVQPTSPK